MTHDNRTCRVVSSAAPIRIADFGGWTDTWFARFGRVLSIAVEPCVHVLMRVFADDPSRPLVTIDAANYSDRYTIDALDGNFSRHPLLEATLQFMGVPSGLALEIEISSKAPAGGSTGTSAAVCVALIGALDSLTPGRMSNHEVAVAAHRVETEWLGQQCGVQDQLASAYGGINYIEIPEYPNSIVTPLKLAEPIKRRLSEQLFLVYLGRSHSSSTVHEQVIAELSDAGPESKKLETLRRTPILARDALLAGDFETLGCVMIENTEAQANLSAELVSSRHRAIIEVARRTGAIGWKVNGAGGEGGSITLLGAPNARENQQMVEEIIAEVHGTQNVPISVSPRGFSVREVALCNGMP